MMDKRDYKWYYNIGIDKNFYVKSSGKISVWAGDTTGDASKIKNLGDDVSFVYSYYDQTNEVYYLNLHTLNYGAALFSLNDKNTALTIVLKTKLLINASINSITFVSSLTSITI